MGFKVMVEQFRVIEKLFMVISMVIDSVIRSSSNFKLKSENNMNIILIEHLTQPIVLKIYMLHIVR